MKQHLFKLALSAICLITVSISQISWADEEISTKDISKEDWEIIKNLDILEILDILEEDADFLENFDIIENIEENEENGEDKMGEKNEE